MMIYDAVASAVAAPPWRPDPKRLTRGAVRTDWGIVNPMAWGGPHRRLSKWSVR